MEDERKLWVTVINRAVQDATYPFYHIADGTKNSTWQKAFEQQYKRLVAKTMKYYNLEKKTGKPQRLNWFNSCSGSSMTTAEHIREGRAFCLATSGSWARSRADVCEAVDVCPNRLRSQVAEQCAAVDNYEVAYKMLLEQLKDAG